MGLELRVGCCKTENRKFFKAEGIEYGMGTERYRFMSRKENEQLLPLGEVTW